MSKIEEKTAIEVADKEIKIEFSKPKITKKSKGTYVEFGKDEFMKNIPDNMIEAVEKTFDYMKSFDKAFHAEAERNIVEILNKDEDEDRVFVKAGWGPSLKGGKGERTKYGEVSISGTRSRNASAPGSKETVTKPYFVAEHTSPYLVSKEDMRELQKSLMEKLNKY